MTVSVLVKLRSSLASFTPVLQRIAEYVLKQPDKVIYHTVTELAEASSSSEASVMRFCKDLGFSGFQDFKLTLALDVASSPTTIKAPGPPETTDGIIEQVVQETLVAIGDMGQLLDAKTIERVACHILQANRTDIYGVGASGVIASYFHYKLIRLGLTAQAYSDPHLATMSAAQLTNKSVAIGISSSGSIIDTVDALAMAKRVGAFTIAVTNRPKSPLTTVAELSLVASSPESPLTGGAAISKISQLLLLEVLFTVMTSQDKQTVEAIHATAEAVVSKSF